MFIKKISLLCACMCLSFSVSALDVGTKAPDFLGKGVAGDEVRVSQFKGRILVVTFWASWCGPCVDQVDNLEKMLEKFPGDDVSVVAVNYQEDLGRFDVLNRETLFTSDAGGVLEAFGLQAMPYVYVIDRAGVLRYMKYGFKPGDGELVFNKILGEVYKEGFLEGLAGG